MTPDEAVISGYSVIMREMVPRGMIYVINETGNRYGRPIVAANPSDYFRLAFPDPMDHLDRYLGYLIGKALDKFDRLHPEAVTS